jgi:hypothetical protein
MKLFSEPFVQNECNNTNSVSRCYIFIEGMLVKGVLLGTPLARTIADLVLEVCITHACLIWSLTFQMIHLDPHFLL